MMCRNFFVIIIATLLIFPSNLALAGSIPEYYAEMWEENGHLVTKMYVEPDKMRVEFHKGRDKPTVTLYRMDQDKWYVLHDDKKMYVQMPWSGDRKERTDFYGQSSVNIEREWHCNEQVEGKCLPLPPA